MQFVTSRFGGLTKIASEEMEHDAWLNTELLHRNPTPGRFFFNPAQVGETLRGCAVTADRISFGCVGLESERNVPLKDHESNNLQSGRRERMDARPPTVSACETAKDENNRGEKQPRAHKRTC